MTALTKTREAEPDAGISDPVPMVASDEEQRRAEEYELRVRDQQREQFQKIKDEARTIFGLVEGRPGVKSVADWEKLLDRAGDDIGNGRFIVGYLGAERYLDAGTVALLITLRQNLIAELDRPKTVDIMKIDAAIVAYYNFLRTQKWIGDLSMVFEAEVFGQKPLSEIHGETIGNRLRDQIERLADVMLPLQDRCHRMMARSFERLPRSRRN